MTTGSGSTDPRRKSPEKSAIRYEIQLEDLELITDITIANYNATTHTALHGRSPLDYIRSQINSGRNLPRYTPQKSIDGLALFERDYNVTIRANSAQGHRPRIKFLGVRYTGDAIETRSDLTGKAALFRVDIRDIRTGKLFLEDGSCLGEIQAEAAWMTLPHSIQIRRAINKLIKQNRLADNTRCPINDYMDYLKKRALKGKKERNQLINAERITATSYPDEVQSPPPSHQRVEKRSDWISIGIQDSQIQPKNDNSMS